MTLCNTERISVGEAFQMVAPGGMPDDVAERLFPEEAVAELWHAAEALAARLPNNNFVRHPGANPYAGNPDDNIIDPLFADDGEAAKKLDIDGDGKLWEFPF